VLLLYVWISGFAGVLITDMLQTVVILVSSLILFIAVLIEAGGPAGLAERLRQTMGAEAQEVFSVLPVPGHEVMGPLVVAAWFIVPTIGQGGSLDVMGQRIFSCRSLRDAASVPIWAAISLFAMLLLVTLPVLGMLTHLPELYHAAAEQRETVYGMMLNRYLPPGLLGLALAGLLASVMSTLSSYFNYGAQTLVNDVYRQIRPRSDWLRPDSSAALWVGRLTTLMMVLGAILVVFASDSLFKVAAIVAGLAGASAPLYWGQWWWWRVNSWSWLTAVAMGPAIYFALGRLLPQTEWWQTQSARSPSVAESLAILQALIGMALTTALWISVTLWTKPQPMSRLMEFYRRARPMGAWEPVREALRAAGEPESALPPRGILTSGLVWAVVGATMLTLGVLGISQVTIGEYRTAAGLSLGALIAGLIFRRGLNHHLTRLSA
jgi:Na+/proline symporter